MNYIIRRLLATLPVMGVVAGLVFLLIHLSPGDPAALLLPEAAFDALKTYALRDDAEPIVRYFVQRGREYLRVGPYVGLLQATPSVAIEVLPKIAHDLTPESVTAARASLLRMLQPEFLFQTHWVHAL